MSWPKLMLLPQSWKKMLIGFSVIRQGRQAMILRQIGPMAGNSAKVPAIGKGFLPDLCGAAPCILKPVHILGFVCFCWRDYGHGIHNLQRLPL